jgi:hypothetical protein
MSHREVRSTKLKINRRTRCRRRLPQRRRDYPPGWGGAAGAGRALAAGGPPHVLRREHGRHSGAGESARPCSALPPERCHTQARGEQGRCAVCVGGGSDLAQRQGAGARSSSQHSSLTLTIQVRSSAKLDKSIVSFQHGVTRGICTSGMTARHSTLFSL